MWRKKTLKSLIAIQMLQKCQLVHAHYTLYPIHTHYTLYPIHTIQKSACNHHDQLTSILKLLPPYYYLVCRTFVKLRVWFGLLLYWWNYSELKIWSLYWIKLNHLNTQVKHSTKTHLLKFIIINSLKYYIFFCHTRPI